MGRGCDCGRRAPAQPRRHHGTRGTPRRLCSARDAAVFGSSPGTSQGGGRHGPRAPATASALSDGRPSFQRARRVLSRPPTRAGAGPRAGRRRPPGGCEWGATDAFACRPLGTRVVPVRGRPRGAGSVVLAGHVDLRRFGVGPLADLHVIGVGDRVEVTTGQEDLDLPGRQHREVRPAVATGGGVRSHRSRTAPTRHLHGTVPLRTQAATSRTWWSPPYRCERLCRVGASHRGGEVGSMERLFVGKFSTARAQPVDSCRCSSAFRRFRRGPEVAEGHEPHRALGSGRSTRTSVALTRRSHRCAWWLRDLVSGLAADPPAVGTAVVGVLLAEEDQPVGCRPRAGFRCAASDDR